MSTSLATVMDATSYGGVAGALASVMPGVAATHADRLSGTTTIVLRPPPDGSAIDVGDVDIPGGVAVRFVASAPWATRLRYTGARGYMFKVAAGYRHVSFDGLIFEGGGVNSDGVWLGGAAWITGAQCEGANVLENMHKAIGWE